MTKQYCEAMAKQFHHVALGHKWQAKACELEGELDRQRIYLDLMKGALINEAGYKKMAKEVNY